MLENKGFDETFGNYSAAPYLSQTLPDLGALVPNYYGVTHVSLGNYIALISGQGSNPLTQTDCQLFLNLFPGAVGADGQASGVGCVYPAAVKTVADQLSAAGLSWKGYMEDMGGGLPPSRDRVPGRDADGPARGPVRDAPQPVRVLPFAARFGGVLAV